jgi:hypothetical protein
MKKFSKVFVCAFVALLVTLAQQARADFIGMEYETAPEISGWQDYGGGLLEEPVWYHFYKRQDNAYFLLINWKLPRKLNSQHVPFRVIDTLLIPPIAKNHTITFDCKPPQTNVFIKIFAVVRMDRQEWWRDVRQAWKVELDTGKISPFPTKGVACLNEGYGV